MREGFAAVWGREEALLVAMSEHDRPSEFRQAIEALKPPQCPSCGEARLIEYIEDREQFYCGICATTWPKTVKA